MKRPEEKDHGLNSGGFTLVEILIAMAILSTVMVAVFSIYNMQHKVTHIEEDVVDVQQNLRMGLDSVLKDLRVAGFLVPGATDPIGAVANDSGLDTTDTLTLNMATASDAVARVDAELSTNVTTSTAITLTVGSASEVALFDVGDVVRIIDSGEQGQPLDTTYSVTAKSAGTPSLSLLSATAGTAVLYKRGAMIVRTGTAAPDTFPNTVEYCLGPDAGCAPAVTSCPTGVNCLMRIVNGTPANDSVVATNITDLQFRYIVDGSAAESDAPGTLSLVRAVRVTLTGQTADTAGMSGGAKTRTVTSIAKIRNR